MSDVKTIIVGDTRIHCIVEQADTDRAVAVNIALEMIKSSCGGCGERVLSSAMGNLSLYANQIQDALNKQTSP